MTIATTSNKTVQQANGATTQFPFSFLIPNQASLQVYYTDTEGTTSLVPRSAYTVTGFGNPAGGYVTYIPGGVPLAAGFVTVVRIVPINQTTQFVNQGPYNPATTENAFDYRTFVDQQLQEQMSRALLQPPNAVSSLQFPALVAGMYLAVNGSGTGLEWTAPGAVVEITSPNVIVSSMTALMGISGSVSNAIAFMVGYYMAGDMGVVSVYRWSSTSMATHDAGVVVRPTAIAPGDPGRWLLDIGDVIYAMQYGILDDGDGIGGGTDNLTQMLALTAYAGTRERLQIEWPRSAGIICYSNHIFWSHCGELIFHTNGCRFQSIRSSPSDQAGYNMWFGVDYFTNRAPGLPGFTGTVQMPFYIDSVASGDTQFTLKSSAIIGQFQKGGRVQLMGYDQQGYGYPPNFRYFEPAIIRDVDTGTNTVYLDRSLRDAYNEDWFELDYPGGWITGPGYVATVGPASVVPIDRPLRYGQRYLEIDHLEYLRNPYDTTPFSTIDGEEQYGSRSPYFQGWDRMKIGTCLLDQFAVGQGGVYEIDYLKCIDLQGDKLLDTLIVHSGHIVKATDGTGIRRTYFGPGVTFKFNLTMTGPNVEVDASTFTNPDDSTGNRPIGTAFFNSADSFKINGAKFAYGSRTGVIAGGNFQEDVTDPDRPGIWSVTATAAAAGQFTAALGDGTARITLRKGTKLMNPVTKEVFRVSDITWDGTDFVVLYTGTGTVSVADKLWYYPLLSLEVGGNNIRTGAYANYPLCDDKIAAQHYTDVDAGMTAGTINKALQIDALPINGTVTKTYLDGYIQEIEVNIIKAYTGAGSGNLVITVVAPNGDSYSSTINTKNTGRRRILAVTSVNNKTGDTLTDLGYDKYIMGAGIAISASDNTGDIGCKGTVRFIGVRR